MKHDIQTIVNNFTVIYDIEVYKDFWCVVGTADGLNFKIIQGEHRDNIIGRGLQYAPIVNWLSELADGGYVMGAWNGFDYDSRILQGMIDCKDIYILSNTLINTNDKAKRWQGYVDSPFKPLGQFDLMECWTNDVKRSGNPFGLKKWEAFEGRSIVECPVPFDKPVTDRLERKQIMRYCVEDVKAAWAAWQQCKGALTARLTLIQDRLDGNLSLLSNKQAQIAEWAFTQSPDSRMNDELRRELTLNRYETDVWELPLRHKEIADLLTSKPDLTVYDINCIDPKYPDCPDQHYKREFEFEGLLIQVGIGGVHGSIAGKWTVGENCAAILHYDYKSWYPHLLMPIWEYGATMSQFYDYRAELKAAGNPAQLGYKLAMNSVSGRLKFPYSSVYNPAVNNSMVLRGQLGLLWLAEVMSKFGQVVHINTDGIIVICQTEPDTAELQLSQAEIEAVVCCELERDYFTTLIQLDMNNHAEIDTNGKLTSNGRFAFNYNSSLPRYVVKRLLTPDAEITSFDYCLFQSAKKSLFMAKHKGKDYPATQQFQFGDELIPEKELRYVEVSGGKPIKKITAIQDNEHTIKVITLSQSALLLNDTIPDAIPNINHDFYSKKYNEILMELESTVSSANPLNWERLTHIPQKLKKDGTPYKHKKMECGICGSDSVALNRHTGQYHCYKCASDILYRFADGLWYPAAQAKLYEDGEFEMAQAKLG